MDAQQTVLICSNEPSILESAIIAALDAAIRPLVFKFSERDALRRALSAQLLPTVVLDLDHADESCLDIIGLVQRAAPICKLLCATARKSIAQIANRGDSMFALVPLPASPVQLRKQLAQAPAARPLRFQGPCGSSSLLDIVLLLLFSGLSGRLIVWNTWVRGDLWIHKSHLVHAELGGQGLPGLISVQEILKWPRGTFRFQKGRAPNQTVQLGPYQLLLLAAEPNALKSEPTVEGPITDLKMEDLTGDLQLADSVVSSGSPPAGAAELDASEGNGGANSSWSPPEFVMPAVPGALSTMTCFDPADEMKVGEVSQPEATQSAEEQSQTSSIEHFWQQIDASILPSSQSQEEIMAVTSNSVKDILARLEASIEGFIGAAVADSDSGMCLGSVGGAGVMNVEVAAANNTEVVRAKRKAMKALNLRDDIEDILISLGKQYHLIRPLRSRPAVFIYLAVDRARANLAMTRFALADAERDLGA